MPVQVSIRYKNEGIIAPAGQDAGAVHIDGNTVDLNDEVAVAYGKCDHVTQKYYEGGASRAIETSYFQKDFSITGIFITGEYIEPEMVFFSTSSPIYTGIQALRAAGDGQGNPRPVSNKNLADNSDGTYTLSLSVTGKASTGTSVEVTKSNVIIVMDRSNSMTNSSSYTWVKYTYNADNYNTTWTYRTSNTRACSH